MKNLQSHRCVGMLKICCDVLKGHPQKPLFLFPKTMFCVIPAQTKPSLFRQSASLCFSAAKQTFLSLFLCFRCFSMRRLMQLSLINSGRWLYICKKAANFPSTAFISLQSELFLPCLVSLVELVNTAG